MKFTLSTLLIAFLLCISSSIFSQTITKWTGAASSDWVDPGNWTNGVPVKGFDARIESIAPDGHAPVISAPNYVVDYPITNKKTLTIDGTVTLKHKILNSGSLEINNKLITTNKAFIKNTTSTSSIKNAGVIEVCSTCSLVNNGTVNNQATAQIKNTGTIENNASVSNQGTLDIAASAKVTNTGTLENQQTAKVVNSGQIDNAQSATISNKGSVEIKANASLNNQGTLNNAASAQVTNTGTIDNQATATVNNSGKIVNAPTATISNKGSVANLPSAEIINQGTMSIPSPSATIDNKGSLKNEPGGTISNTGKIDNQSTAQLTNKGNVDNAASASVTNYGELDNQQGARISNEGTVDNKEGSTMDNKGTVTNEYGAAMTMLGIFTNNGQLYYMDQNRYPCPVFNEGNLLSNVQGRTYFEVNAAGTGYNTVDFNTCPRAVCGKVILNDNAFQYPALWMIGDRKEGFVMYAKGHNPSRNSQGEYDLTIPTANSVNTNIELVYNTTDDWMKIWVKNNFSTAHHYRNPRMVSNMKITGGWYINPPSPDNLDVIMVNTNFTFMTMWNQTNYTFERCQDQETPIHLTLPDDVKSMTEAEQWNWCRNQNNGQCFRTVKGTVPSFLFVYHPDLDKLEITKDMKDGSPPEVKVYRRN